MADKLTILINVRMHLFDQLNSLPLEQKIGQLFFVGLPGPEFDEQTKNLLAEVSPGGVCLFARNIREAEQTRKLLRDINDFSNVQPFLSIDQEGGLVDRLRRVMTPMPPASKLKTPGEAANLGTIIAETLLLLGFNMDFAPVVDVIDDTRAKYSNGLHSRAFGHDKKQVVEFASGFLSSLQNNGIVGCLKHFPGLGASQVDSHEELPIVDIGEDELSFVDLYPYKKMVPVAKSVMIAHACFPKSRLQETDKHGRLLPSSLSRNFVTRLLRDELQFDGLVITDDLEMGAIVKNYGIGDACKMAVAAGIDMLAICADPDKIIEGYRMVLDAVKSGEITTERIDQSLKRIALVKADLRSPTQFDKDKLQSLSAAVADFNQNLS